MNFYSGIINFAEVPDEGLDPECSRAFGYFPDQESCDVYYLCEEGKAQVIECPDGLLFPEDGDGCDFPHIVDCGNRTIPGKDKTGYDHRALWLQPIS